MELYLIINERWSSETIEPTAEGMANWIYSFDKDYARFGYEFFAGAFEDYCQELIGQEFGDKFPSYIRPNQEGHRKEVEQLTKEAWKIYKKLVEEASK